MTAKATEAGQLIQKLKTEITAQNAPSHLLRDDYQMPDIAAAKSRHSNQEERIVGYRYIHVYM